MLTAVGRSSYIVIIVTFLNSSSSSNNLGFSNCLLHIHYIISCGCFRACLSLHHELYLSVRFRSAPAIIYSPASRCASRNKRSSLCSTSSSGVNQHGNGEIL